MQKFVLHSKYKPCGDQPQAIAALTQGINDGLATQVLRGVTGSGKTFTMANIIANVNRPALVICHNKTLAAQLCNEFREFFPENRIEFFVSYYDYYMPESYIPSRDLYIEKEIDDNEKLRQVSVIREIINTNSNPLTEFDDSIFKAIVDKVIVRTPVSFSFVLINGMEFTIDGREYSDGRKFKTREY